jgi:hypothetical protein
MAEHRKLFVQTNKGKVKDGVSSSTFNIRHISSSSKSHRGYPEVNWHYDRALVVWLPFHVASSSIGTPANSGRIAMLVCSRDLESRFGKFAVSLGFRETSPSCFLRMWKVACSGFSCQRIASLFLTPIIHVCKIGFHAQSVLDSSCSTSGITDRTMPS